MEKIELIKRLNKMLLSKMPEYSESAGQFDDTLSEQRRLLRSLMNVCPPGKVFDEFFELKAGFDKRRLFYTQGDYGLFQCSVPCHNETYDNERAVREMYERQRDMKIPSELIPKCPKCGRDMVMNLRVDSTFVQDGGWYAAAERYDDFIRRCENSRVVFLELGVGFNTPAIIKYPFWEMTGRNDKAFYICINKDEAFCPDEIKERSLAVRGDINEALGRCF